MHPRRIHDGIWAVIETQMPLEECEKLDINKKGRSSCIYTGRVFFVLIVAANITANITRPSEVMSLLCIN
jgi:hypothetical protein